MRSKIRSLISIMLLCIAIMIPVVVSQAESVGIVKVKYYVPNCISITIPQSIDATVSNNRVTGNYSLRVEGSISPSSMVVLRPVNSSIRIQEKSYAGSVIGNITQEKRYWSSTDVRDGMTANGTITAEGISAGNWTGSVEFVLQVVESSALEDYDKSIWCWDENVVTEYDELIEICRKLKISKVYQCVLIPDINETAKCEELCNFIRICNSNGIDVYWTNGDPTWTYNVSNVLSLVDRVKAFNSVYIDTKIKGIITDIESYNLPSWENSKEDISENFIARHKEIFAKTKPAGLELGVAMNNAFFNELLKYETLDSLMNECCDYYTFMLYNSDYQVYHADSLIEYAKLFNKKVEIISEMQKDVSNDYEHSSIDEVEKVWKDIVETYNCSNDNVSFSFHSYNSLKDILN